MKIVEPGHYRHYKGGEYDVVGTGKHSETLEELVVYRARYGDKGLWARPLEMWHDEVDYQGQTVPRFRLLESTIKKEKVMPYQINIIEETKNNENFRKVLFTGGKSQLVVMDIKPGEEIGEEVHPNVEQTLFFLSGSGKAVLDDVESEIGAGDVVVVTPGVKHNFLNTGEESLKVYTIYAPANHIDGRVHVTPAEAEADQEDEDFGHAI